LLRLTGAIPIDGGVPIIMDGKVIGAVGVSGGSGEQDSLVEIASKVKRPNSPLHQRRDGGRQ
jgi:uncharacterized protein GlcG (DUF336 family)